MTWDCPICGETVDDNEWDLHIDEHEQEAYQAMTGFVPKRKTEIDPDVIYTDPNLDSYESKAKEDYNSQDKLVDRLEKEVDELSKEVLAFEWEVSEAEKEMTNKEQEIDGYRNTGQYYDEDWREERDIDLLEDLTDDYEATIEELEFAEKKYSDKIDEYEKAVDELDRLQREEANESHATEEVTQDQIDKLITKLHKKEDESERVSDTAVWDEEIGDYKDDPSLDAKIERIEDEADAIQDEITKLEKKLNAGEMVTKASEDSDLPAGWNQDSIDLWYGFGDDEEPPDEDADAYDRMRDEELENET